MGIEVLEASSWAEVESFHSYRISIDCRNLCQMVCWTWYTSTKPRVCRKLVRSDAQDNCESRTFVIPPMLSLRSWRSTIVSANLSEASSLGHRIRRKSSTYTQVGRMRLRTTGFVACLPYRESLRDFCPFGVHLTNDSVRVLTSSQIYFAITYE